MREQLIRRAILSYLSSVMPDGDTVSACWHYATGFTQLPKLSRDAVQTQVRELAGCGVLGTDGKKYWVA